MSHLQPAFIAKRKAILKQSKTKLRSEDQRALESIQSTKKIVSLDLYGRKSLDIIHQVSEPR
jgi:hypothetical protein